MISDEYAAGFFDGEGSVYATVRKGPRRATSPTILVCCTNTNREILEAHQKRWGGSIWRRKMHGNRKVQYQWVLCTRKAVGFLRAIHPHLVVKRPVVGLAIQYCDLQALPHKERLDYSGRVYRRGRWWVAPRLKESHKKKIAPLFDRIRELNARGAPRNAMRQAHGPIADEAWA